MYYIGGEDVQIRNGKAINQRIFSEVENCRVLIFLWTSEKADNTERWRKLYSDYFIDSGAGTVNFADIDSTTPELSREILAANILYLPGGDPRILIRNLIAKGIDSAIKQYQGIVVGNSAGAMVMAKTAVFLRGQGGELYTSTAKGLSLDEITVAVHYGAANPLFSGLNASKELIHLSMGIPDPIYAISEGAALVVDDGKQSFFGKITTFENGRMIETNR